MRPLQLVHHFKPMQKMAILKSFLPIPQQIIFVSKHKRIKQNSDRIQLNATKDSISIDSNGRSLKLNPENEIGILVCSDEELNDQVFYLESTINAISKYTNNSI